MKFLEEQFSTISTDKYEPQSLKDIRSLAFDQFKEIGFPKKNWEAWRFTSVDNVEKNSFRLSTEADLPEDLFKSEDGLSVPTLLFLNGHYQPDESNIPTGIKVNTLRDSYNEDAKLFTNGYDVGTNPFVVLNTAMMNSGLHIRISENIESHSSIRFLSVSYTHLTLPTKA